MTNKFFSIFLISIILLSVIPTSSADQPSVISPPQYPPGHPFYQVTIIIESLQETLTFNTTAKVLLMKKHLDKRISELQYESLVNGSHVSELIKKIQIKRIELDNEVEKIKSCDICTSDDLNKTENQLYGYIKKHNQEVLSNLINNPAMPEHSKKGLMNALNRSGIKVEANMVQGVYTSRYSSLLPFRFAQVHDPMDGMIYSVIIRGNTIEINQNLYTNYDTTLFPTKPQMEELNNLARKVGKKGLTMSDKIKLMNLWFDMRKGE